MESQGVSGDRNPSNLRIKKTEYESQCIFTSSQFGSQFPQTRSSEVDTLSHQIQQTLGMPQPLQSSNTQATTMPGTAHNVTSRQYTGHRSLSDTVEGFYSVEHGREHYSYPCLSERPQQCQERSEHRSYVMSPHHSRRYSEPYTMPSRYAQNPVTTVACGRVPQPYAFNPTQYAQHHAGTYAPIQPFRQGNQSQFQLSSPHQHLQPIPSAYSPVQQSIGSKRKINPTHILDEFATFVEGLSERQHEDSSQYPRGTASDFISLQAPTATVFTPTAPVFQNKKMPYVHHQSFEFDYEASPLGILDPPTSPNVFMPTTTAIEEFSLEHIEPSFGEFAYEHDFYTHQPQTSYSQADEAPQLRYPDEDDVLQLNFPHTHNQSQMSYPSAEKARQLNRSADEPQLAHLHADDPLQLSFSHPDDNLQLNLFHVDESPHLNYPVVVATPQLHIDEEERKPSLSEDAVTPEEPSIFQESKAVFSADTPSLIKQLSVVKKVSPSSKEETFSEMPASTCRRKKKIQKHRKTSSSHRKLRPHACPVEDCESKFCRADELSRHMRMHTGSKPYVCAICERRFSRKDHLLTHERTHTGERRYQCSICEKRFTRGDELKRHGKVHAKRRTKRE